MRRYQRLLPACVLVALALILVGCDVPKPPPELPTATPGSSNPESASSLLNASPVRPTAAPDFSPVAAGPGHIYFVRSSHLWVISPPAQSSREGARSGERQLSDLTVSSPPAVSPDGSKVAFLSGNDLYVLSAAGGTTQKVASGTMVTPQHLDWSGDGSRLGYMTYDPANPDNEQAWALTLDGSKPTLITNIVNNAASGAAFEQGVHWSPDGKWVLVAQGATPMQLLPWPPSSDRQETDIPGGEPDWTPDSLYIVYAEALGGAIDIYDVLGATGTPFRNELQPDGTGQGQYAQGPGPLWSPASYGSPVDPIAYRSHTPDGKPRVAIRRRDTQELPTLPELTNNPSWSPSGIRLVVETGSVLNDPLGPKWVPDGLAIADIHLDGTKHGFTPLVQNAQWPVWSK